MTLFSANNMTSNIQHGVTSHYASVSGGATAKSLEGMKNWDGLHHRRTKTSQWRASQEVDQELSKMGGATASRGQKTPSWSRGKAKKLMQNIKIVQISTFSCTKFLNFINTGAELGQYFCAHTIQKIKIRRGV